MQLARKVCVADRIEETWGSPLARWQGGVLFDDAVRDHRRLSSANARSRVRSVGDLPYYVSPVIPLLVDPLLVAWLGRHDGKAGLNLALVGFEAFAYAGLSRSSLTRLSLRQRPDSSERWRENPGRRRL